MISKKFHFVLVLSLVFCAVASGEAEFPLSEGQPILLDVPNPALGGIEELYVIVECGDGEPNKEAVLRREVEGKVGDKLTEAGIRTASKVKVGHVFTSVNTPELKVDIDLLELEDSGRYVFHVQTSLASKVCFEKDSSRFIKADVWKSGTVMGAAEPVSMTAEVTGVVLEQVEAFVHAYHAANSKGGKSTEVTSSGFSSTGEKGRDEPAVKTDRVERTYVGSKNSKVFHKAGCKWAGKIKPENLVGYSSREEAVRAGRRPCMQCRP